MHGYDATTYGDAFADVYDDWYHGISDVGTTVTMLTRLVGDIGGPVRILELGVGTGRLAVPLAMADPGRFDVTGIDASSAMLDRLRAHDPDGLVEVVEGHMVTDLPDRSFDLVVVAYNTLFNLTGEGEHAACFDAVARRLTPDGRFVVEAFVPDDPPRHGDDISVRTMTARRVVLSITRHEADTGRAEGHFVELTEENGVRLRPWSIRYRPPGELDELAAAAGLDLESRCEDMAGTAFTAESDRHVSVYRRSAERWLDNSDAPIA